MKSSGQKFFSNNAANQAEETLRLIAGLPAPEGLVDRVQAGLRSAPRRARVLHWPPIFPTSHWMQSTALRSAAAAAIVCVVAGGGWRIYSHVQLPVQPSARVIAMPARVGNSGAFSSANAIHTPDTLNGPVVTHIPDAQSHPASRPPAQGNKIVKKRKIPVPAAPPVR